MRMSVMAPVPLPVLAPLSAFSFASTCGEQHKHAFDTKDRTIAESQGTQLLLRCTQGHPCPTCLCSQCELRWHEHTAMDAALAAKDGALAKQQACLIAKLRQQSSPPMPLTVATAA